MSTQTWADHDREPDLTLTLDQPQDWLSANARLHWARKADLTRYWRQVAGLTARKAHKGGPFDRVHVVVTFHRADKRDFDPSNYAPTSKACLDGLVDAGLVRDDSRRYVVGPDERYGQPGQRRIVIDVYRLEATP